jgi:predicted transcriptional regulator
MRTPTPIRRQAGKNGTLLWQILTMFFSWLGIYESPAAKTVEHSLDQSNNVALTARDIMNDSVETVRPEDGIEHTAKLMRELGCSSLPVVDGSNKLVGMISDNDITVRLVARSVNITCSQVSDCMTYEVFACESDSSIENCLKAMYWHEVSKLAIVDQNHRVIGILSLSDVAWHAQHLISDETTDWPAELLCLACSSTTRVRRESYTQ